MCDKGSNWAVFADFDCSYAVEILRNLSRCFLFLFEFKTVLFCLKHTVVRTALVVVSKCLLAALAQIVVRSIYMGQLVQV